jgi:NADH:ubiquinone oxidoreductase subunit F (NADH-binding)
MINQKIIDINNEAKKYLKENEIYTSDQVEYGFTKKIIELTMREVMEAVERADLRERTITTFDDGMMKFCKSQVKKELNKIINIL